MMGLLVVVAVAGLLALSFSLLAGYAHVGTMSSGVVVVVTIVCVAAMFATISRRW